MKTSNLSSFSKHADFIVADLVALVVAFVGAFFFKFHDFSFVDSASWKALLVLLLSTNLVITLITNPYSGIFRRRYWEDIGMQLMLAIESFLAICVVFYLVKIGEDYSREMLIITYVSYLALALVLKYLHKRRLLSRWHHRPRDSYRRVVLITSLSHALVDEELVYADDMSSSEVVGFCLTDVDSTEVIGEKPAVPIEDVLYLCGCTNADEVLVLADPATVGGGLLESLMENGIQVRIGIREALGVASEVQSIGQIGVFKTLDLQRHNFGAGQMLYLPAKRIFDIIIGLAGSLAVLPIAAVVKLCYLSNGDNHPIFYKQTRIGRRGKPFQLWKLRSMVWNADEVLQKLLEDPALREKWDRDQKLDDDPRVTPVGRVLRRTSLDEFPQFFNILKGDMSVVGPRPLIPGELEDHGGRPLYNKVKPGLTGWWGCNGRSNIEYYERLELEYYYVTHCSLYLDALCVFRTAVSVVKRDGAQ